MEMAEAKMNKTGLRGSLLGYLYNMGILGALRSAHRNSLTVLNYHRVEDHSKPAFDTFKPNVSASPELFAAQMEFIKRHYTVITCEHVAAWLQGKTGLPPYPALITFDDGYLDNLTHAQPVLKRLGLSAVIFLATAYINKDAPFYWDYVAYCFRHTQKETVQIPGKGPLVWNDPASREKVLSAWINAVKFLSDEEKRQKVDALAQELNVAVPANAFAGLCLTWDQVRELHDNGIEFGAHTVNHPILTRISLSQAESELTDSKRKIEQELGKPIISFAYPNGQANDYSPEIVDLVRKTGFRLAFTLLPGPTRLATVRKDPFTIRRIFLGRSDTLPRFTAKLAGAEYLAGLIHSR